MGDVKPMLSDHAKVRRKEMRVTEDEIAAALDDPELVYPGFRNRTCYLRGRLVVIANNRREVITLLWHGKECRD